MKKAKENLRFYKNGFSYLPTLKFQKELKIVKQIIKKNFSKDKEYYNQININQFRQISNRSLKEIYKKVNIDAIKLQIANYVSKELNLKNDFYASSYITLLINRPKNLEKPIIEKEFHGFHRESFYAGKKKLNYVKHQMNCWIPIFNLKKKQNLMYVPKSHKISDDKIKVQNLKSKIVKKGSISHKLGYLHTQKKILSGVDLGKAKRFNVPDNKFLLFNGNLIHGNGENLSKKIRFAIGIGLINASYVNNSFPLNFRSGESHFKKVV
jgi:hypothetical protein